MYILTLNIGSSSIKYQIFNNKESFDHGVISGIGTENFRWDKYPNNEIINSHSEALIMLSKHLANMKIDPKYVCHRVVHGGDSFFEPCVINDEVLKKIEGVSYLAPLHNPEQYQGILSALKQFPLSTQIAFFDTAFHKSMPESQKIIPISGYPEIKKYGFHGINYAYINDRLSEYFSRPCSAIVCHLGNGASICAIKDSKSYATSMGMTPNAGLIMGTRSGDFDSGVIFYLSKEYKLSLDEIDNLLNKDSGLKGISGFSDMRDCEKQAKAGDIKAQLALDTFCQKVVFYIGGYHALIGKIDALVFTGGIGENSSLIRSKIIKNLSHLGFFIEESSNSENKRNIAKKTSLPVLIIPAAEEQYMAMWVIKKQP